MAASFSSTCFPFARSIDTGFPVAAVKRPCPALAAGGRELASSPSARSSFLPPDALRLPQALFSILRILQRWLRKNEDAYFKLVKEAWRGGSSLSLSLPASLAPYQNFDTFGGGCARSPPLSLRSGDSHGRHGYSRVLTGVGGGVAAACSAVCEDTSATHLAWAAGCPASIPLCAWSHRDWCIGCAVEWKPLARCPLAVRLVREMVQDRLEVNFGKGICVRCSIYSKPRLRPLVRALMDDGCSRELPPAAHCSVPLRLCVRCSRPTGEARELSQEVLDRKKGEELARLACGSPQASTELQSSAATPLSFLRSCATRKSFSCAARSCAFADTRE
ncbi:hypothetical protein Efla_006074 [Eimeria flavescens]